MCFYSLFKKLNFLNLCFNSAILISGRGRDLQYIQLQSVQLATANRTGFDGLHVESGVDIILVKSNFM